MMKSLGRIILILFLIFPISVFSQSPNYSEDIAPILYSKCTECHNPNGIAPFSLMNYQEASTFSPQMVLSVISGNMPPWPPDTNYQRFAHEKILSANEINKIINWNNLGAPQGDSNLSPTPPNYQNGAKIKASPDYTMNLPIYSSNANSEDEYICFTETTTFNNEKWINAIEVIPGNLSTVHHAIVYIDNSGNSNAVTNDCMGVDGDIIAAYVPGAEPTIFPNGENLKMGVKIPIGAKITTQMHYPAGSAGSIDSTKINFFFYDENENNIREVYNEMVLQNWDLNILPNTNPTYLAEFPPANNTLDTSISLLAIFPHMHLIGKEITTFCIDNNSDTIPLCRIPHWDFEWQGYYNFNNLIKIPTGSKFFSEAKYDNTSSNPHNPNNPPQLITAGENTDDEMFVVFLQYAIYQDGDESLNLSNLLNVSDQEIKPIYKKIDIYPNPINGKYLHIQNYNLFDAKYSIIDISGKNIKNGYIIDKRILIDNISNGEYFLVIINNNIVYTTKFIKF